MADIFAYVPKAKIAGTYLRLPKAKIYLNSDKTEILMSCVGVDDMNIGTGGIAVITDLTSSDYAPTCGDTITLTANLLGLFVAGDPTGTITFYNGSTVIGSGTVAGGVVAISIDTLPAGTNTIHAVYSGDVHYLPSTSVNITVTVSNIATTTLLVALPNPVAFGDLVTFIAEVSPDPAIGTAVNFFVDTALIGVGHTNALGIASVSTSSLSVGSHSVYAAFTGGACYAPSTSNTVTEVVGASSSSSSSSSSGHGAITFTTPGDNFWLCPDGVNFVRAEAWGSGGNGFGFPALGGGGGGGSYCRVDALPVTPGNTYLVTVATGGSLAVFSEIAGDSGSPCKAINGSSATDTTGAPGGSGSFGDVNFVGGNGANISGGATKGGGGGSSAGPSSNGNNAVNEIGGAAVAGGGAGGNGGIGIAGNNGSAPGGGGGGSGSAGTNAGTGANGQVVLTW